MVFFFAYNFIKEISEDVTYLKCDSSCKFKLPKLPESLKVLDCSYSHITSLPALPKKLRALDCSYSHITSLPTLPQGLIIINEGTKTVNHSKVYYSKYRPLNLISIFDSNEELGSNSDIELNINNEIEFYQNYPGFKLRGRNEQLLVIKKIKEMLENTHIRKKMSKYIIDWIYKQGMKPGGFFVKIREKKFKEHLNLLSYQ